MDQPKAIDVDKLLTLAGQDTEVLAVLLFGSLARGEPSQGSDVDVCLILMPQRTPYEGGYAAARRCNGKELGCSVRYTPAVAVGRVRL
jgi:DNA polymerase sigma